MKLSIIYAVLLLTVTANAQIRHYPLDGNANELINNQNGILGSGASLPVAATDRFGNFLSALYFDGNDYIVIPQAGLLNNVFSITAWLAIDHYPSSSNTMQAFIEIGDYNTYDQIFGVGNYSFGQGFFATGYTTSSTPYHCFQNTVTPLYNWYFFAATYNYDYARLYIDGVQVDSQSTLGILPNYGSSPAAFIGTRYPGISGWRGKIDDIKIYDYALSPGNISGINEEAYALAVYCYPNPASDKLKLKYTHLKGNLIILNTLGQTMSEQSVESESEITFDIELLPEGLYFIKEGETGRVLTKFVKQ